MFVIVLVAEAWVVAAGYALKVRDQCEHRASTVLGYSRYSWRVLGVVCVQIRAARRAYVVAPIHGHLAQVGLGVPACAAGVNWAADWEHHKLGCNCGVGYWVRTQSNPLPRCVLRARRFPARSAL
jgi:hypothetical protein